MRQIKFRGRVINRKAAVGNEAEIGDLVTGSLIIYEEEPARRRCWIKRQEKNHVHIDYPVDEDSIAQLVGYDAHGREVYEGDEVVDKFGEKYLAQLTPTLRENHEGAGGVFSKPTERFWTERRQYTPLTLVEQCT